MLQMLNTGRGKILAVALALLVWGRADDVLADAPLIMPVRAIDLGDVQQCYRDPHPGGFCDGCKSPNNGNNSLTNYVILREAAESGWHGYQGYRYCIAQFRPQQGYGRNRFGDDKGRLGFQYGS